MPGTEERNAGAAAQGNRQGNPATVRARRCRGSYCVCTLFSCLNGWDWYIAELDRESGEAFGLVKGFETEWGYFSIPEMENLNRSKGFEVIERDEHFAPAPMGRVAD